MNFSQYLSETYEQGEFALKLSQSVSTRSNDFNPNGNRTIDAIGGGGSSSPSPSLFNIHEMWGIAIATLYFLIGFPSNLISIIICFKSLFSKTNHNSSKRVNFMKRDNPVGAGENSIRLINYHNPHNNANNSLMDVADQQLTSPKQMQLTPINDHNDTTTKTSRNFFLRHFIKARHPSPYGYNNVTTTNNINNMINNNNNNNNTTNITRYLNGKCHQATATCGFSNVRLTTNPHRKCFELYLIEISFCDLYLLAYFFAEFALLVLSKYKIIDSIYMEPVLISKFACQFLIAFNRLITLLHNWLVAFMALTRCYAVYKPLNSTTYYGPKFYFRLNLCILAVLILLFTAINVFGVWPLTYKMIQYVDNVTNQSLVYATCTYSVELYERVKYMDAYVNITVGIIGYSLPCLITLVINLILIYNIRNLSLFRTTSSRGGAGGDQYCTMSCNGDGGAGGFNASLRSGKAVSKRQTPGPHANNKRTNRARNQFFKTSSSLLTLSFCYLICYIPYSLLFFLISLNLLKMNNDIIFALTCLRNLNHTLNFYIYLATGKRFRNEVFKFLGLRNE